MLVEPRLEEREIIKIEAIEKTEVIERIEEILEKPIEMFLAEEILIKTKILTKKTKEENQSNLDKIDIKLI